MSAIHTINRRAFLSTGASLVATGASFMMLSNVHAGTDGVFNDPVSQPRGHQSDDDMQQCIQLCQDCHALCVQTVGHCLTLGGRHATPDHIRVLLDCAEICETTAHYLLRESPLHARVCGFCADVCRQCADSCQQAAGEDQMVKQCVEMCRRCAKSCDRMSKVTA
jgi:hypothetical protein